MFQCHRTWPDQAVTISPIPASRKAGYNRDLLAIELQALIDLDFDVEVAGATREVLGAKTGNLGAEIQLGLKAPLNCRAEIARISIG